MDLIESGVFICSSLISAYHSDASCNCIFSSGSCRKIFLKTVPLDYINPGLLHVLCTSLNHNFTRTTSCQILHFHCWFLRILFPHCSTCKICDPQGSDPIVSICASLIPYIQMRSHVIFLLVHKTRGSEGGTCVTHLS